MIVMMAGLFVIPAIAATTAVAQQPAEPGPPPGQFPPLAPPEPLPPGPMPPPAPYDEEGVGSTILGMDQSVAIAVGIGLLLVIVLALVAMTRGRPRTAS
jgi:hypothetical protein